VVVALVLALPLLAGCAKVSTGPPMTVGGEDDGVNGALLTTPYDVADLELTDTSGQPYSLARDTQDKMTLVFFGYTHCPDICQVVMATIASALTRLQPETRSRVGVVFVTTDPARDDRATLRGYLDRFDPSFVGLTADPATIKRLGKSVGVFVGRGQTLPDGGYEIDHSTPVIGVERHGRAPIVWTQGVSSAQLAADLQRLVG
jgi:protein SCO1/2